MRHHLIARLPAALGMSAVTALATLALAITPTTANADDGIVGERVRVCDERLELNREPNEGWDGVLAEAQTFGVRRLSASGKYAYGFAFGDINRLGWVRTSGLCRSEHARDALAARLVSDRVAVAEQLRVTREPAGRTIGTLAPPQTFRVRKLSESGKYAYGFAYGEANELGWVLTADLTGDMRR